MIGFFDVAVPAAMGKADYFVRPGPAASSTGLP